MHHNIPTKPPNFTPVANDSDSDDEPLVNRISTRRGEKSGHVLRTVTTSKYQESETSYPAETQTSTTASPKHSHTIEELNRTAATSEQSPMARPREQSELGQSTMNLPPASPAADGMTNVSGMPSCQPTLLQQVLVAAPKKSKRFDVAVVLDLGTLSRTIYVDSKVVARNVPCMAEDWTEFVAKEGGDIGRELSGINHLFVLDKDPEKDDGMPILLLHRLDKPGIVAADSDKDKTSSHNSASSQDSANGEITMTVKQENSEEHDIAETSDKTAPPPQTDWVYAYGCFLRIISPPLNGISISSAGLPAAAALALPVLEAVVTISELYRCTGFIRGAFKGLLSDYIHERTLYAAIAQDPAAWLALSIKLRSDLVYKEAFVHLVGQYTDRIDLSAFPENVVSALKAKAHELRYQRMEVNEQLFLTSLGTSANVTRDGTTTVPADMKSNPELYSVINVFQDWLRDHVGYLSRIRQGETENLPKSTLWCSHTSTLDDKSTVGDTSTLGDHSIPECCTLAGFYRTIARNGDAYLAPDDVLKKWNRKRIAFDEDVIREGFPALKKKAKEIVAPLVDSKLSYEGRDKLAYLTCTQANEVPWANEVEDEDVEMEED